MDKLQDRRRVGKFLSAVLVAVALCGCATSREQPPAANANGNVAAAPQTAHPIVKEVKTRPAVTHAAPAASSKMSAAAILAQMHQANLREIAIGKMAEEKASTGEVRAYADQVIQDHMNADQMVAAMAQKIGAHSYGTTAGPRKGRHESARGKLVEQKLSSATGEAFDRLFLEQTSSDEQDLIRALQQEREDASDDEIEGLIDKLMPILEQQRDLAQILMKKEQA